jgi:hypothetical protein
MTNKQDYLKVLERKLRNAEYRLSVLEEENEVLEEVIDKLIKRYTTKEYNETFHMGWKEQQCQEIDKRMTGYCRAHAFKIRRVPTEESATGYVNSYGIPAWESFVSRAVIERCEALV